jgi:hypothetical protein
VHGKFQSLAQKPVFFGADASLVNEMQNEDSSRQSAVTAMDKTPNKEITSSFLKRASGCGRGRPIQLT